MSNRGNLPDIGASAITIENLRHSFGEEVVISIDALKLQQGKSIFVHGSSGSGKTTLLGLVSGVLHVQNGSVSLFGESLREKSLHERDLLRGERMGYIFQQFNLLPFLNVLENVCLPCRLNPKRLSRMQEPLIQSAEGLLQKLGIAPLKHRSVTRLSVGEQQRVAAARALLGRPDLIIADEPTSALDDEQSANFIRTLTEQARETNASVLFVSHDKDLEKFFDQAIELPKRQVVHA